MKLALNTVMGVKQAVDDFGGFGIVMGQRTKRIERRYLALSLKDLVSQKIGNGGINHLSNNNMAFGCSHVFCRIRIP